MSKANGPSGVERVERLDEQEASRAGTPHKVRGSAAVTSLENLDDLAAAQESLLLRGTAQERGEVVHNAAHTARSQYL